MSFVYSSIVRGVHCVIVYTCATLCLMALVLWSVEREVAVKPTCYIIES